MRVGVLSVMVDAGKSVRGAVQHVHVLNILLIHDYHDIGNTDEPTRQRWGYMG